MQKKIEQEEDFIHAPKHQNSLKKYLAKMENVPENGAIGRLLLLSAEEVGRLYEESILELKREMVDED
jgi:hypothetical protein